MSGLRSLTGRALLTGDRRTSLRMIHEAQASLSEGNEIAVVDVPPSVSRLVVGLAMFSVGCAIFLLCHPALAVVGNLLLFAAPSLTPKRDHAERHRPVTARELAIYGGSLLAFIALIVLVGQSKTMASLDWKLITPLVIIPLWLLLCAVHIRRWLKLRRKAPVTQESARA